MVCNCAFTKHYNLWMVAVKINFIFHAHWQCMIVRCPVLLLIILHTISYHAIVLLDSNDLICKLLQYYSAIVFVISLIINYTCHCMSWKCLNKTIYFAVAKCSTISFIYKEIPYERSLLKEILKYGLNSW